MHRTGTFASFWLGTLACAAAIAPQASALPGDPDPGFGIVGRVVTDFGGADLAFDTAIQPDGKIVAAGSTSGRLAVARYNPDGSLDPTFGGDGTVVSSLGDTRARAVAIQPDGRIVVAGPTGLGPNPENLALVRYNPDGSLDGSFDGDGLLVTDLGGSEIANGVAIGPGGRIVTSAQDFGGAEDMIVVSNLPDGTPDGTFGGDGAVEIDLGGDERVEGLAVEPDGRIVVSGFTVGAGNADFVIARMNPDGSNDASFGGSGIVVTDRGGAELGFGLARMADGRYVVGGIREEGIVELAAIARYNPDGSLDQSFAGGGFTTLALAPGNSSAGLLVAQPDGKLVIGTGDGFTLARLTSAGSPDPDFGIGGFTSTAFGGSSDSLAALALQDDGGILAAGWTDAGSDPENFALARFAGGDPPTCRGRTATIVATERVTLGTDAADVIVGTARADRIKSGKGPDRVCALGGRDRVNTGGGRDVADGGKGRDVLRGAGGRDRLLGAAANDTLNGGAGGDALVGGKGGRDRCVPGRGDRVRGC